MIAIIAALRDEVAQYLAVGKFKLTDQDGGAHCYRSQQVRDAVVVVGGVGRPRAEKATRLTAERFRPDLIISTGFAGGAQVGLKTGDLVLCETLWAVEGPLESWSPESAKSRGLEAGTLPDTLVQGTQLGHGGCLTVPRAISQSSVKRRIGATFPVSIVDMESFWVSQTAAEYGVPHLVVRCVLDPVEQSLPPFVGKVAADGGAGGWKQALTYALSRPAAIPELIRLGAQAKVARASLAAFLTKVSSVELPSPAL